MPLLAIPFPEISPFVFQIGGFGLRWYALAYIAGIVLGWRILLSLAKDPVTWGAPADGPSPISRDDVDDLMFYATLGILLGGRLGFVLFYQPQMLADPLQVLKIWEGGMSFHGGFLGVCVAVIATALSRKISLWRVADAAAIIAPFGLLFGRVANFVNQELYGRAADVPWAFIFATDPMKMARHPSQLYQAAMEGLLLALILWIAVKAFKSLHRPGLTAGLFMIGYAIFRTIGEQFRQPDDFAPDLPGFLTMGATLSIPMALVGLWFVFRAKQTGAQSTPVALEPNSDTAKS
jgi:phosphatidylglycerol---prolipoprotein diacylglyceryl transferase